MKKLLNKPWFVATMALIAIAFVANAVMEQRKPLRTATHDDPYEDNGYYDEFDDTSDQPEPSDPSSIRQVLESLVPTSEDLPSDPFDNDSAEIIAMTGSGEPEQEEIAIHLSAIWAQGDQTLVLVNNHVYTAGDTVGDLTIESTTIDGIWVTHPNGQDFVAIGKRFTWVIPAQSRDTNPTLAFNEN
ncbi:MAG: hypothetical protein DRP71_03255 [Verrucomicrobia bacterium]|nr:MAG: hypothetical protein DRP71_03255 [Verrucomicrobiota bacterium]